MNHQAKHPRIFKWIGVKAHLVLLLVFLCWVLPAYTQPSFPDSLPGQLENYTNTAAQEKVFVHTDKTFYLAGETLWFKAYVVRAATNQPLDLSKVLYVELLDDQSKPVLQSMIDLQQGAGDGSFLLSASLNSGMYTLRAYTAWMKNSDPAFFFQTPLQIVNTTRMPDWHSFEKNKACFIQFFPEGGNLVEGIPTRLAFELTDEYGKGIDGTGCIIENGMDTVVRFRPMEFGIGSFNFTPAKGATYKAVIRFPDGEAIDTVLPSIYNQGFVLQLKDVAQQQLQVSCATMGVANDQPVYLLAHTRGLPKLFSSKLLENGKAGWLIDKKVIGEGITTFTLFDKNSRPVCERLYFKRPLHKLNIELQTDAQEYSRRSKVNLNITTAKDDSLPSEANLSLSVFLMDSLQKPDQLSIEEYLWLVSDLKGNIESPAWYFNTENEQTNAALDNLMLTHGWRRFSWENLIEKNSPFTFLPDYEGAVIRARITSKISGQPLASVLCYLSVPGKPFFVTNALSNEKGEINFILRNVYGPVELIAQADRADSTIQIDLLNSYSEKDSANPLPKFVLPETWKDQLKGRHLDMQMSHYFSANTPQQLYLPLSMDTTAFYGKPDKRYPLDEYTRFPTMEEVMKEVVAEVRVQKNDDRFQFRVLNTPFRSHFDTDPLVLLDGVPIFNAGKILKFDPLKIKQIGVVARKYFWGNLINNGIISYSTYEGNLAGFVLDPAVMVVDYNGMQVKRQFYTPVYATPQQVHNTEPDRRTVLSWMPSVLTDLSGEKQLSFYTSDVPGRYAVKVQGINKQGNFGSKLIMIEVK